MDKVRILMVCRSRGRETQLLSAWLQNAGALVLPALAQEPQWPGKRGDVLLRYGI